MLRVSIGHIEADVLDVRNRVNNLAQLFIILFATTRAHCYILQNAHKVCEVHVRYVCVLWGGGGGGRGG